ncbi:hypothetical protein B296_00044184 [Ensete ventricosum]|uniref:Uncharacterized protein n=1 Tax=Ensete ventricosum TaxID=4639 RepID=A0A426X670_ENSVE|nr:hypothetical protein B296_00044184 [Ensete ventricosum]
MRRHHSLCSLITRTRQRLKTDRRRPERRLSSAAAAGGGREASLSEVTGSVVGLVPARGAAGLAGLATVEVSGAGDRLAPLDALAEVVVVSSIVGAPLSSSFGAGQCRTATP